MALQTSPDINVRIIVPGENSSAPPLVSTERRITPAWTVAQLKGKLEPITGIPASCQSLRTRTIQGTLVDLSEETAQVGNAAYGLRKNSEIEVLDTRPPAARQNFTDPSAVEKYEMPKEQYEQLDDSVLAWKRRQQLGRFDPHAKSPDEAARQRRARDGAEVDAQGIAVGRRCNIADDDARRGEVRFVGEIPGLGGEREAGCVWVGVELDEPVGRNDGSVRIEVDGKSEMRRIFAAKPKFGLFARPEKVTVGDFPPLDDLDEDMEEI